MPNLIKILQEDTKLTKRTLLEILKRIDNLDVFFKNPYQYANYAANAIKLSIQDLAKKGISYIEIGEDFPLTIFDQEVQAYEKYIVKLNSKKTLYQKRSGAQEDVLIIDPSPSEEGVSQPEKRFAELADSNSNVRFIFKLPDTYFIDTPVGKYTPDWAVVIERENQSQIYFIAETKDTNISGNLRLEEQIRILSARAMIKQIMPEVVSKAPVSNFLISMTNHNYY